MTKTCVKAAKAKKQQKSSKTFKSFIKNYVASIITMKLWVNSVIPYKIMENTVCELKMTGIYDVTAKTLQKSLQQKFDKLTIITAPPLPIAETVIANEKSTVSLVTNSNNIRSSRCCNQ